MAYGFPPIDPKNFLDFQQKLKKWKGVDHTDLLNRGYSPDMVDFIDKLL